MRAEAPQGIAATLQLGHEHRFRRTVGFDDAAVRALPAGRRGEHSEPMLDLRPVRRRDDGDQLQAGS